MSDNSAGDKDYGIYIHDRYKGDGYRIKSERGKEFFDATEGYEKMGMPFTFDDVDNRLDIMFGNKTQDFTAEELDDLNHFRLMAGLQESGQLGDEKAGDTIHDHVYSPSRYLRNQVMPNVMDKYDSPNYVFTLYMLKQSKYAEYQSGTEEPDNEDESKEQREDTVNATKANAKTRNLNKPAPEDIVIIAQTGATDLGIDNVEIMSLNGMDSDMKPLKIEFTITEPGSITLLDRLAEARAYCGYRPEPSTVPGLFLELSFRGYTDPTNKDRDEGGKLENIPFGVSIDKPSGESATTNSDIKCSTVELTESYFELGGVTYDMAISAEQGSVYGFSCYRQQTGGRDTIVLGSTMTISGKNLTELFGGLRKTEVKNEYGETSIQEDGFGLEYAYNKNFDQIDKTDTEDKDSQKRTINHSRSITIDISDFIENSKTTGDDDPSANEKSVHKTENTISNSILKDFSKLETFAKSGTFAQNDDGSIDWTDAQKTGDEISNLDYAVSKGKNDITYDGDGNLNDPSGQFLDADGNLQMMDGGNPEEGTASIEHTISVGGASADVSMHSKYTVVDGKQTYTDPIIEIRLPTGTHLKDAMYLVLSLSEDFVNKAIKVKNPGSTDRAEVVDSSYVRWLTLDTNHYYDYSDDGYDEEKGVYDEYFYVRPVLSYNSSPNMMVFREEFENVVNPDMELIKRLMHELGIQKEYYYSFTGLNDQVVGIDFNFDEAFAIQIPTFSRPSYAQQSIIATSSSLSEDQANKNTNNAKGVGDQMEQTKKASGILDSLSELSDGDLTNFAEYVGYSDEEVKRLINEKNANGTGVRGSAGWRYEDQLLMKDLASALSVEEIGGALLSGYSMTPEGQAATAPQQGDEENPISTLVLDYGASGAKYIYASELVLGLEGQDAKQMADLRFQQDSEAAIDEARKQTLKPRLEVVDVEDTVKEAPIEMDSIRPTTMSHLMRQATNARSHLQIDMSIRGDPYWLGTDCFYGQSREKVNGADWVKKTHDILFVMEAPRRLDNNLEDEDNNTGLFDYGNLNYTMSGVYQVTGSISKFSEGLFTQDLNMFFNSKYEMSKIEMIKKTERKWDDPDNESNPNHSNYDKTPEEIQALLDDMANPGANADSPTQSDVPAGERDIDHPSYRPHIDDNAAFFNKDGSEINERYQFYYVDGSKQYQVQDIFDVNNNKGMFNKYGEEIKFDIHTKKWKLVENGRKINASPGDLVTFYTFGDDDDTTTDDTRPYYGTNPMGQNLQAGD